MEGGGVEGEVEIEQHIGATDYGFTGSARVREGYQAGLHEGDDARRLVADGFGGGVRADVAQNGRVQAAVESDHAVVRVSSDPVISNGLVCGEDEGVPLASIYLDGVDVMRHDVLAVHLNDCEVVVVDGEREIRVAGDRDETEAVTQAVSDSDRAQGRGRPPVIATQPVDQSRI